MRLFEGTPFDRPPRCERCGALEEECTCPPPRFPPESQTVRLAVEKRRKGKVVTALRGLSVEGNDLPELLRQLKSACEKEPCDFSQGSIQWRRRESNPRPETFPRLLLRA